MKVPTILAWTINFPRISDISPYSQKAFQLSRWRLFEEKRWKRNQWKREIVNWNKNSFSEGTFTTRCKKEPSSKTSWSHTLSIQKNRIITFPKRHSKLRSSFWMQSDFQIVYWYTFFSLLFSHTNNVIKKNLLIVIWLKIQWPQ